MNKVKQGLGEGGKMYTSAFIAGFLMGGVFFASLPNVSTAALAAAGNGMAQTNAVDAGWQDRSLQRYFHLHKRPAPGDETNGGSLKGWDSLKLRLAKNAPGMFERAIHSSAQHRWKMQYLAFIFQDITAASWSDSSLAKELWTKGSPVHQAYNNYINTHPGNRDNYRNNELKFVMAMLRYIKETPQTAPGVERKDIQFYNDFISRLKSIETVDIARRQDTGGIVPGGAGDVFMVPVQLLARGHRGMLGSVTDMLQQTAFSIYPGVWNRFFRPRIRLLFSGMS